MAIPDPFISYSFEDSTIDDLSDDGVELIADHDMAAPTAAAYTAANSAALSKVSNGAGGNALHVLHGGVSNPYATQAGILGNGISAIARVRARGDGVVNGVAQIEGGTTDWYPQPSTAWQERNWEYLGGTPALRLGSTATGAGEYTDFDSFSLKKAKKQYLDLSGNNLNILRGDGSDIVSFPSHLYGKGAEVGSVQQYLKTPDPLKVVTGLTVSQWVKHPASTALSHPSDMGNASGTFYVFLLTGGTSLRFYTGTVGAWATIPSVVTHRAIMHMTGLWDGANTYIYIDGLLAGTASGPTPPAFFNQDLHIGRRYNGTRSWLGKTYEYKLWDQGLTPAQIQEEYQAGRYRIGRLAND